MNSDILRNIIKREAVSNHKIQPRVFFIIWNSVRIELMSPNEKLTHYLFVTAYHVNLTPIGNVNSKGLS